MTREQWQMVREVLAGALELKQDDRPEFLDRVCSSDASLRSEVERLLSSSDRARSSFLESSFLFVTLMPGTMLGDYKVMELIGSGGMGEVYRARDTRLRRDVAIKVLPSPLLHDGERLRRFEQEAQATAALNHPNILAVFQMGTYESAPYIVSELLDGNTLREELRRGPMPVRKAIDFAVQVARGLAAAHDKGIVHRDLKPENIFITNDGRAKILDFGLAKLTQGHREPGGSFTTATDGTDPGVLMGTAGYMSPEQVSGKPADHRADIFAFGAILYEVLTGQRAFQKPTSVETMSAILNEDPVAPSKLAPTIHPALEKVVRRCLERSAAKRFQSASDLALALEALSDSRMPSAIDPAQRGRPIAAIVATLGLVLLSGSLIYYFAGTRQPVKSAASAANPNLRVVPLTSLPGWARGPALSPDGERVAFFWNGEMPAKWSLYVQLVGGEEPLQLTRPTNAILCCADWSPDGREIVFGHCDDSGGTVFIIPALGGAERKLTDVVCSYFQAGYPKWTSDGKSLVLIDRCTPEGSNALVLFSLSTGKKKCLHAPPADDLGDRLPSLSPDGNTIAFLESPSIAYGELYAIQTSGTGLRQLTHDQTNMGAPMWSPDGKNIIFYSERADFPHFWTISAEGGPIAPETTYPSVGSLSRDGRRLAYEEPGGFSNTSTVWRAEFSSAGGRVVSQIRMLGSAGGNNAAQLSPDESELVFVSGRSGVGRQIWKSNADGASPLQLTSFNTGFAGTPRWSPDGKFVVFDYHTAAHAQIYLVDPDGRNLHAITSGNYENVVPSFSRDGKAIYFASNRTHDWQVWKHELPTGRETQVTHQGGFAAFESYDGQTLFFSKFAGGGIWAIPVGGGQELHLTDAPHRGYWGHFAVADSGLYFIDSTTEPGPTIFFYSFKTHRPTPVLMLKKDAVAGTANLASSRDGRTLFYAEWEPKRSIMLAENFR
jgi:serine/threonine protein kinase